MIKLFEEYRCVYFELDKKVVEKFVDMLNNMFPGRFVVHYDERLGKKTTHFSIKTIECEIVDADWEFKLVFYLASRTFAIYGDGVLQNYIKSKTGIFTKDGVQRKNYGSFDINITQKDLDSFELSIEEYEIFKESERFGL